MIKSKTSEILNFIFVVVVLGGLGLFIYGQTVSFDFVSFDDYVILKNNPDLYKWSSWKWSIPWAFTSFTLGDWQPLTWISLIGTYRLFGLDPGAYHLSNVFIHLINGILLYSLMFQLLKNRGVALMIAALFVVHPQHVESVAWISERKDVLSCFFWLLTALSYLKYVNAERYRVQKGHVLEHAPFVPGTVYYLLTLFLFLLGILTKPTLVTLPFVFLLLDFGFFARRFEWKKCLFEKIPFFLLVIFSCVMTVLAVTAPENASLESLEKYGLSLRLANAFTSTGSYLVKTFFPHPLYFYYPYPKEISIPALIASIFVIGAISVLAVFIRKKSYFWVGWFWFLGSLVPVSGLLQVGGQAMADRYTYFAHMGLFMMIVFGACELMGKFPKFLKLILCLVVIVGLTGMSFRQVKTWKNSDTLYSHSLRNEPRNFYIQEAYCVYLMGEKRYKKAEEHCRAALKINAKRGLVYWDLGKLALEQHEFQKSLNYFKQYIRIILTQREPDHPNLKQLIRETEKKLSEIFTALRQEPKNPDIYYILGNFWIDHQLYLLAADAYVEVLRYNRLDVDGYINLANVQMLLGKFKRAKKNYHRALKIEPANYRAHFNYGLFLVASKKYDSARKELTILEQLDPAESEMKSLLKKAIENAVENS